MEAVGHFLSPPICVLNVFVIYHNVCQTLGLVDVTSSCLFAA
jgi:hypothetical protein